MDPARAAQALRLLRPRVAVPIHWGTLFPRWRRTSVPDYLTEPARAFQREAGLVAPGVNVRVLAYRGTAAV
jgi:L-ascorbate metabolism protein UlaG (beta-lactamase superfamily)